MVRTVLTNLRDDGAPPKPLKLVIADAADDVTRTVRGRHVACGESTYTLTCVKTQCCFRYPLDASEVYRVDAQYSNLSDAMEALLQFAWISQQLHVFVMTLEDAVLLSEKVEACDSTKLMNTVHKLWNMAQKAQIASSQC